MSKTVLGKSTDPVQQALRDAKAKWNKDTREFISNLIEFKRLVNGSPSKFSPEKGRIQNPLNDKTSTILSQLVTNFSDIAEQAHQLSQQQLAYSKNRKQKSVKISSLSAQINELEALASNPVTRFLSRIKNTTFFDSEKGRIKKYRMSLLSACADIYRDVLFLQEEIVKSSPESIFISAQLLSKIEKRWLFVISTLEALKAEPIEKEDVKVEIEEDQKETSLNPVPSKLEDAINDTKGYISNFLDIDPKNILQKILRYQNSKDQTTKENLGLQILLEYKKLLDKANSINDTDAGSFKELFALNKALQSKTAQNAINKWVGKIQHKLNPFDKTSASRLDIYNECKPILEQVDKFMDSLEAGLDIVKLNTISSIIVSSISDVKSLLSNLLKTVDGQSFENKFIDLLDKGKLTEYDVEFDSKQKDRLQRILELKRFRDISNQYEGKK